jgi:hypothetical protein
LAEHRDEMLCEMCEERPATRALPRGPRNEGHLWVCDLCNPYVTRESEETGGSVHTVEPPPDLAIREFCDGLAELIADAFCDSNIKLDEQP